MEFFNIVNKINLTQFGLDKLSSEEKNMIVQHLKSKITNTSFDMSIKFELLVSILNELTKENKDKVVQIINRENMLDVFRAIKGEETSNKHEIVRKYFTSLEKIAQFEIELDIDYSDKYIFMLIQACEIDIDAFNKEVETTRDVIDMLNFIDTDTYESEEKRDVVEENNVNNTLTFVENFTKGESVNHFNTLTVVQYDSLIKLLSVMDNKDKIKDMLVRLNVHYVNKTADVISRDLVLDLLLKIKVDSKVFKATQTKLYECVLELFCDIVDEKTYMETFINQRNVGAVVLYTRFFEKTLMTATPTFTAFKNIFLQYAPRNTTPAKFVAKTEYTGFVNTAGIENQKVICDMMLDLATSTLRRFLKSLDIENFAVVADIFKSEKYLETTITNKKFYQVCNQNGIKFAEAKAIYQRVASFFTKKFETVEPIQVLSAVLKIPSVEVETTKRTIEPINANRLKNDRVRLTNMVNILKDQGSDCQKYINQIKYIDAQLTSFYSTMGGEEQVSENLAELKEYHDYLKENNGDKVEIMRIRNLIVKYSGDMNAFEDNLKSSFVVPTESKNDCYDSELNKLMTKYENDFETEEKAEVAEINEDTKQTNIKLVIRTILANLDSKFNKDTAKFEQHLYEFLSKNMKQIVSKIYKNIVMEVTRKSDKEATINHNILNIIKMFTMSFFMHTHADVDFTTVYDVVDIKEDEDKENTYMNKDIRVIQGIYKGFIGTVFSDKGNNLLVTQDTFGKTHGTSMQLLKTMKLTKSQVKFMDSPVEQTYTNKFAEVTKSNRMFPILQAYFKGSDIDQIEELYNIMVDTFNSYKSSIQMEFATIQRTRRNVMTQKKQLKSMTRNTVEYLNLLKSTKKQETSVKRSIMKFKRFNITKKTLTMTTPFCDYEIVNECSQIINIVKDVATTQVGAKRRQKFTKAQRARASRKIINEVSNQMDNLMADLMA